MTSVLVPRGRAPLGQHQESPPLVLTIKGARPLGTRMHDEANEKREVALLPQDSSYTCTYKERVSKWRSLLAISGFFVKIFWVFCFFETLFTLLIWRLRSDGCWLNPWRSKLIKHSAWRSLKVVPNCDRLVFVVSPGGKSRIHYMTVVACAWPLCFFHRSIAIATLRNSSYNLPNTRK